MRILKGIIIGVVTIIGSAVVYENSIVGARALSSDMRYIKACKDGRNDKKNGFFAKRKMGKNKKVK